jgi:NarL family two-component system response regulator LiaR
MIRVMIADDHHLVRSGFAALLQIDSEFAVVAEASDGVEAVLKARSHRPDVLLLDLLMPRLSGLDAIPQLRQDNPELRILVLTSFSDDDMVYGAIKQGALGYLLKTSTPAQLAEAIRAVHAGELTLTPGIARKVLRELDRSGGPRAAQDQGLTERELAVLGRLARGFSNQEIADALVISERTVRTHVSNILSKLHLTNRTQAALYALKGGLAKLEDAELG